MRFVTEKSLLPPTEFLLNQTSVCGGECKVVEAFTQNGCQFLSNLIVDVWNTLCKGTVWPLFTSRGLAAVRFGLSACKRQVLRALFISFQTNIFPTHDTMLLNRKWTMLKNHKFSSILSDDERLKSTSAKTTRQLNQRAFRFYFACYPYPHVWVVLVSWWECRTP